MFYEEAAKDIQDIYKLKNWRYGGKIPSVEEIDEQIEYWHGKMKEKKLPCIHDKTTGIMIFDDPDGNYFGVGISLNWNKLKE